jgi:hypothetical protein
VRTADEHRDQAVVLLQGNLVGALVRDVGICAQLKAPVDA